MKFFKVFSFAVFVLACLAFHSATARPESVVGAAETASGQPDPYGRVPVVSCDLLSGLGVNHSVCAAHCLLLGKSGGYCDRGICRCR
uniref:Invertebrate defensins family profile domain-containing protein n=1 Tax=Musca domestica TaxID=7370 RepID=A0A1I8NJB1_MUSDO